MDLENCLMWKRVLESKQLRVNQEKCVKNGISVELDCVAYAERFMLDTA